MVSTMFRTMQEFDPELPGCPEGPCHDGEKGGQGERSVVSSAGDGRGVLPEGEDGFATESKIESATAACVLWSTVGVGSLIGGRPKSSVSQLLGCCKGGVDPQYCSGGGLLSRQYDGLPFPNYTPVGGVVVGCGMARCLRASW